MEGLPERKHNRLKGFDYSTAGAYFLTICTKYRKHLLSTIRVGGGALDAPVVDLSNVGKIVNDEIQKMNNIYNNMRVIRYVIMPNHIHLIIEINDLEGRSGSPAPTRANSSVSRYVSALKRFTNKKRGVDIWQRSYYDHIIRNEQDYMKKREYILNNPVRWDEDIYYI